MIDKDEFLKILPKLIREDDAVRGAIIAALSGVVATRDDIRDLIREMEKRFEAIDKRFEVIDKRFEAMEKRMEMLVEDLADTRRTMGLLKTFLETNIADLHKGQKRVEKLMLEIREWMQTRDSLGTSNPDD